MPRIGLLFELSSAETRPGEMVRVVGDRPELGSWDPYDPETKSALELRTGPTSYPRWGLLTPVWIELSSPCKSHTIPDQDSDEEDEDDDEADSFSCADDGPMTPKTPHGDFWEESSHNGSVAGGANTDCLVQVEYKFLKDRRQLSERGPSIQWEDSIANRRVSLPCEPGTIWVISDARFNDAGRTPKLARASLPEVVKRWNDLDPEWTSKGDRRDAPEWSEADQGEQTSPRSARTYCSGHTTSTGLF